MYEALVSNGVKPFIDIEAYYYGRDSRTALRDGVLNSRHMIFFVTDAMLESSRGWCVLELAFAELLDANLTCPGGKLANVILPLFLVPQSDARLPRSVWQLARDRGRFFDVTSGVTEVDWCVTEICQFLTRESRLCKNMSEACKSDDGLTAQLKKTHGLFERMTKFQPRLPKL